MGWAGPLFGMCRESEALMKCLSYQQPYAWLILQGAHEDDPHKPLKPIENRDWPLPRGFVLPQRTLVQTTTKVTKMVTQKDYKMVAQQESSNY